MDLRGRDWGAQIERACAATYLHPAPGTSVCVRRDYHFLAQSCHSVLVHSDSNDIVSVDARSGERSSCNLGDCGAAYSDFKPQLCGTSLFLGFGRKPMTCAAHPGRNSSQMRSADRIRLPNCPIA